MAKLDPEARKKVENKIIKYFNALDKTGINTKYYKELFAKMSDNQFMEWMKKPFPIRFQMRTGTTNPTMTDIENSLKAINVPLTEKIYMPYLYRDKDGNPVKEATTGQTLASNILCKPTNKDVIKTYKKNGVDISELPKCDDFNPASLFTFDLHILNNI